MKKVAFLIVVLVCVCFSSCVERLENDGEAQVPDAYFLGGENKVCLSIYTMENTEYLNILRGVIKDSDGTKNKADDIDDTKDVENSENTENVKNSIENIENIAELIPKTSFEDTLPFEDVYVMQDTSYRYCIRYKVKGTYYFSGWSKKVTIPADKGRISPLYIIQGGNDTDPLNIEYSEEGRTITIRTIKESLLPAKDKEYGNQFSDKEERFNENEIEINKNKTKSDEKGFNVGLVLQYAEDENITSRFFSIENLVDTYTVNEDGNTISKYYISATKATNYAMSVLITPDFYGKNIIVDGFIGEQITEFKDKKWTQIVWTRISPVKLYSRYEVKSSLDNGDSDEEEGKPNAKRYRYKLMDFIKIPELNASDNKHDTATTGPRSAGYNFGKDSSHQDLYVRDFSTSK